MAVDVLPIPSTVDAPVEPDPRRLTEREQATELLRLGRGWIELGWCQRHYAVDRLGLPINSGSDQAAAWCGEGALTRALVHGEFDAGYLMAGAALGAVARARGFVSVSMFNDALGRTKDEVLALYDAAIESLA